MFKKLTAITMLSLSFTAFASNPFQAEEFTDQTPEAGSVCGKAYGYDVCVWPVYGAGSGGDDYGLRSSYRSGDDDWVFLREVVQRVRDMNTLEDTDEYFYFFVSAINDSIESKLRPINVEPESGVERIKWLTQNLIFANNELVYTR